MGDAQRSDGGLIVEVRDRVAYATIDRPERFNALSVALTNDLVDAFDSFSTDPGIWAVLLTATGERAFSAGADLKDMGRAGCQDPPGPSGTPTMSRGRPGSVPMTGSRRNFFEVILECAKPTVAAVFGWAMGGGCELGLACDIRFAADDLRIGMPETKRGLGANFGSVVLPRVVPVGLAYQMLYTGEPLDAEDALRWGLVQSVVPRVELDDRGRNARSFDRGQRAADEPALQGHDHQGSRPAGGRRVALKVGAEPVPVRGSQGRRRRVPRTSSARTGRVDECRLVHVGRSTVQVFRGLGGTTAVTARRGAARRTAPRRRDRSTRIVATPSRWPCGGRSHDPQPGSGNSGTAGRCPSRTVL